MKHRTAILLMASFFGAAFAHADLLTYTETATASGSLGGTTFTDSLITLTYAADTGSVTSSGGIFKNTTGTLDLSIASLGSAVFTDTVQVVDNQNINLAGFGDNTTGFFILGAQNGALASYDLKSSIGPVSGGLFFDAGYLFGTNEGAFIIDSVDGVPAFTAAGPSATPEPGLMTLLGLGLAGITVFERKRRTRQS